MHTASSLSFAPYPQVLFRCTEVDPWPRTRTGAHMKEDPKTVGLPYGASAAEETSQGREQPHPEGIAVYSPNEQTVLGRSLVRSLQLRRK